MNIKISNLSKLITVTTLLFFILMVNFGCATNPQPVQKSNLTSGTVKKSVVKGKTTQAEIVQLLGSPNIISKNSKGNEVWTYSKQSFDSKSGSSYGTLLLFGGNSAFSSASSSSFDLIIVFDKNEVVQDYSMVASQF